MAKIEQLSDTIGKRLNSFYSHLLKMNNSIVSKQNIDFIWIKKKPKGIWFIQVAKETKEL